MSLTCFLVSDLHGHADRYEKLFAAIGEERPEAVFIAGDLFPSGLQHFGASPADDDFVDAILRPGLTDLRVRLSTCYPRIFLIMGNDDLRIEEPSLEALEDSGLCEYLQNRKAQFGPYTLYGYAYSPPSQFLLKDWERYDVSRYTDPGCVSAEEGWRTVEVTARETRYATMREDLEVLTGADDLANAVLLLHAPPHDTMLDRAGHDGKMIDYVPMNVHVGSVAIRRLIDSRQPLLTLHGHVHESARLTGCWKQQLGRTWAFSSAHDGPELALVRFDLSDLAGATRELR